jgi:hypothetical protein
VSRLVLRHASAVLLLAQLGAVLAYPFLDSSRGGIAALNVIEMGVVGFALWAVRRTPALNVVATCLGLPALVLSVLDAVFPGTGTILLLSACFHAPFYFYVSYGQIRYLFDDERVTHDDLFATAAAFTVVAWGFSYVYVLVQVLWPGSYTGAGGGTYDWFQLLFLSFTTLSNTGLSDIAPTLGHARAVAIVEEVTGVFYIGLVIARLVGLTLKSGTARD